MRSKVRSSRSSRPTSRSPARPPRPEGSRVSCRLRRGGGPPGRARAGAGAAAIAPGTSAGDADLAWAESILGSVGTVARVTEPLLDAVTGLSGSGPAYIFLVAEALIEAGVLNGLPRPTSVALVTQTLLGSAPFLAE